MTLLHEVLDGAVARHPHAPAVSHGADTLSYAALDARGRAVAGWLRELGVRRGDRVVVALPPHLAVPPLLYGCARAGAVFVVLHEQIGVPGLAHVLEDCEPALLISDQPWMREQAAARGVRVADSGEAQPAPQAGGPAPLASPPVLTVDPVCLIYTSGSTGFPKAVVSTHAQVVFAATAIATQLTYRADDVVYCPLPLSFDYGLYQLWLCALAGAHLVLGSAAEAGPRLLTRLRDCQATVLPAVPSVAEALARLVRRPGAQPPALRLLTNTGAAMPGRVTAVLRERIPGLSVQLMFGLTECKRATIMPPDEDLRRPGACGRALPGTEVFVVDDSGRRLPAGEVGEVVVRGPHVMAGYWRRPELDAQRFRRVEGLFPQLHTGDYGSLDEDGYLYFLGRRDDLYKERGFRVSATEVEAAARRVPGVESAAVLPPGAAAEGAVLVVVCGMSGSEVLVRLREQIEDFKVPRRCVVVDALPLTGNGKVDRAALARLVGEAAHV